MNNFKDRGFKKRGSGFNGKKSFGGQRGGNNRPGGGKSGGGRPTEMFKAECSKCQQTCSLPFKPSTDKPVFCSNCFSKKMADDKRGEGRHNNGGRDDHTKPPRDQRSPRHDQSQRNTNYEIAGLKRQLETIESRLNRILDIINPPTSPHKAGGEVEVKKEKKITKDTKPAKKVVAKATKKVPAKKTVVKEAVKKAVKKVVSKKTAAKKVAKAKK